MTTALQNIAATEFVIGAALVTLGVKASDIFLGLFVGEKRHNELWPEMIGMIHAHGGG